MPDRAHARTSMMPIIVGNLFEWFDFTIDVSGDKMMTAWYVLAGGLISVLVAATLRLPAGVGGAAALPQRQIPAVNP